MMLDTVVNGIVRALGSCGVNAMAAYPECAADHHGGTAVAVGVKSGKMLSSGAGEYLGLEKREDGGERELYGFALELVMLLDVFAEDALGCSGVISRLSALMGSMPCGIRVQSLSWGESEADPFTGMFCCRCEMHCTAHLAAAETDSGEFTDFVLKGTVEI